MATYYPCDETKSSLCTSCNTTQTVSSCCTSTSSSNSSTQAEGCSSHCNTGCNSKCNVCQTLCENNVEYIKQHADVGGYPGVQVSQGWFIHENWTANFWKQLIDALDTAESVGKTKSQGSAKEVSDPVVGNAITASFYNDIRDKLCNFHVSYDKVQKDDIITAARANAIMTAYNNAKFDSNICDVCNSGDQSMHPSCACNCNCSCSCSCNCGCSCPCECACPCYCDCPCGCGCSCSCSSPCSCASNTGS